MLPKLENCSVAIIGLGYVGLPLALEIAQRNKCLLTKEKLCRLVFGYDVNKNRIEQLEKGLIETIISFQLNKLKKLII